ncbi:MAG: HNH endonuclease signature motif containing protein [Rhodocyclaceae bacterium]|nr:HNH endonuclease signature motif containing protein [Rhodocyclaceae bacterium]
MAGLLAALLLACMAGNAEARIKRSSAARHEFVRAHACPATEKNGLPCPGYIIDHVIPLCAGGADAPGNMQWQTIAEAREKDVLERQMCRRSPQDVTRIAPAT